jgi:glycosyltransferase involved in cell wall biosynthesis
MRVAHVITRLIVGGAQENTVASVRGLRAKADFRVDLLSGPTEGSEGSLLEHASSDLDVTCIPDLIRPVHPVRDGRGYAQLTAQLRRLQPDVVHTHSGKAGILGRLAARRAGVPIIVHTIHGPSFGPFQGPLANAVFTFAERLAGKVTDHFVTVCDAMMEQYLAARIGRRGQYTRIWSGFDLAPFQRAKNDSGFRAQLGLAESDFVIGTIARLAPLKGHEDLIRLLPELVKACPQAKLLLVGDGPLRPRLRHLLEQRGLAAQVHFAGLVPPHEVARHVGVMDVLVHLSYREGLPRALPQALAAGKPVVAYDCDGAGEVCREGETGYLLAAGDTAGVARRLVELSRNPILREQLGRRGQVFVRERFSVERMVEDLAMLYRTLGRQSGRKGLSS